MTKKQKLPSLGEHRHTVSFPKGRKNNPKNHKNAIKSLAKKTTLAHVFLYLKIIMNIRVHVRQALKIPRGYACRVWYNENEHILMYLFIFACMSVGHSATFFSIQSGGQGSVSLSSLFPLLFSTV